jgi:anti-sigma regulatory factor (Ser/Thr protein kinase)
MEIRTLGALTIRDASQVSEARRLAAALARDSGLSETETGKLGIVVTEAATNLLKHAREGELVFNSVRAGGRSGIAMLSLDHGPGMRDVAKSLRDGYSTAGSPGTGLGAIRRMASGFDIYSSEAGTVVLAVLWSGGSPEHAPFPLEIGALSVPKAGETVCGDAWAAKQSGASVQILVTDGLGHGADAYHASIEALRVFRETPGDPVRVLEAIHKGLSHTRGAAAALAEVNVSARTVSYAGIGNISGAVVAPERTYNMVSLNGSAGTDVRRIQVFSYPWPERSLLVLHTDGLSQRSQVGNEGGLRARDPMIIAGVLYRDFRREHDDATVIVARDREGPPPVGQE